MLWWECPTGEGGQRCWALSVKYKTGASNEMRVTLDVLWMLVRKGPFRSCAAVRTGGQRRRRTVQRHRAAPPPPPSLTLRARFRTAPIITVFIPGTPPAHPPPPLYRSVCDPFKAASGGAERRSPGTRDYRRWSTAAFTHSAGAAHDAPP